MSSTRKASDGRFHQERYCSSPELEGDAINALIAAKRIAVVESADTRALLWWIQWRSLAGDGAGIQQLCEELRQTFPHRCGTTPALQKFYSSKRREPSADELRQIESESHHINWLDTLAAFTPPQHLLDEDEDRCDGSPRDRTPQYIQSRSDEADEYMEAAADAGRESLATFLRQCCVDPATDVESGCWYFIDLPGALRELRARQIAAANARVADTVVSRQINRELDFWKASGRMILIEGVAGIGRTYTLKAWCDAQGGLVRYVEVPSSTDDRSFYVSIARELGVARGMSFNGQQIKLRVEETLRLSGLKIALDEAQALWGNSMRPRKTPDRILWIKTAFDAGTPIALVGHTDFSKWQAHFVERTLWSDDQFERRINRPLLVAAQHSTDDLLKIARVHFPNGSERAWKLLVSYAVAPSKRRETYTSTATKKATGNASPPVRYNGPSAIAEALYRARYRAAAAGRSEPNFDDINAALTEDGFLIPAEASDDRKQGDGNASAEPMHAPRKALDRAHSTSLSPTDRRKPDRRSAALNPAIWPADSVA